MDATRVIEAVALPEHASAGVLLGDAVREAGLDPAVYLAVIPAEMARGGRVGENGRVYEPESLETHHTRLVQEAQATFITGEDGHPEVAPEGFDVPVRFLGGDVVRESDGTILARGRFGVLNTTSGRDTLTCWRAGMPIGVSLDGLARLSEHVIDGKSRYAAANPALSGQRVVEAKLVGLNRYDVVRMPSLGTRFAPPPSSPVAEAYRRVIESKCLPEAPADAAPVTESSPAQTGEQQENTMPDIKTIQDLEQEFPQLVAQVRESADPMRGLTPEQRERARKVLEAVKDPGAEQADWAKAIREQAEVDRARLADAEKAQKVTEAKLVEATSKLDAITAELAREKTRAAVREALDTWAKGRRHAAGIVAKVREAFEAGKVADAAAATAEADSLDKLVTEALALGQVAPPPAAEPEAAPVTEARDSNLTPKDKPGATQEQDPVLALMAALG